MITMKNDIRIGFIGDSFVNGTGDEMALGWAGRLCAVANRNGFAITYYNLGIRGETSEQIKHRWESESSRRFPDFCDARLVFSCGVNDTAIKNGSLRVSYKNTCANINQILSRAKRKYQVLIVGPPPVADESHNERIKLLSQDFYQQAQALEISYIDLFFPLVSDPIYRQEVLGNDGSHPKKNGYAKMAQIISFSPDWWFPELKDD